MLSLSITRIFDRLNQLEDRIGLRSYHDTFRNCHKSRFFIPSIHLLSHLTFFSLVLLKTYISSHFLPLPLLLLYSLTFPHPSFTSAFLLSFPAPLFLFSLHLVIIYCSFYAWRTLWVRRFFLYLKLKKQKSALYQSGFFSFTISQGFVFWVECIY